MVFTALKSTLSGITIATPASFWLVAVWHIFSDQFIFSLLTSFYLKWMSFLSTAHGWVIFLNPLCHSVFLIGKFRLFAFHIIIEMLGLPFAISFFVFWLFSLCFVSLFPYFLPSCGLLNIFLIIPFWLIDSVFEYPLCATFQCCPDITLYTYNVGAVLLKGGIASTSSPLPPTSALPPTHCLLPISFTKGEKQARGYAVGSFLLLAASQNS